MTPKQRLMTDIDAVCRIYRTSSAVVIGPDRQLRSVMARNAVMWMLRNNFGLSYPRIGRIVKRDHSTVQYGIGRHDARLGLDTATARYFRRKHLGYVPKRNPKHDTEWRDAA